MTRSSRALPAALGALVTAGLFAPSVAEAYCRTSSCPNGITGAVCSPAYPSDCGIELFWPSPCVSFDMQENASTEISLAAATPIFAQAFANWTNADCGGGGHPRMTVTDLGPVVCHQHEYNQDAGNANIIMFDDGTWPYVGTVNTLALTTVTYNLDNGQIYDADMELNTAMVHFTTADTGVIVDLSSIAQHETGHFLGLGHSHDTMATMFPDYTPGTIALRTISPDDIAAICNAYPPGPAPTSCDPTPRHGFSSQCGDQQSGSGGANGSCGVVAPGARADGRSSGPIAPGGSDKPWGFGSPSAPFMASLVGLALLAARRRARRPSRTALASVDRR